MAHEWTAADGKRYKVDGGGLYQWLDTWRWVPDKSADLLIAEVKRLAAENLNLKLTLLDTGTLTLADPPTSSHREVPE